MIYVCIDTNIYIRILLDHNEYENKIDDERYCDLVNKEYKINDSELRCYYDALPKSIFDLAVLCKYNIIKLIVPEITLLELEKANKNIKQDYHSNYDKLRKNIQDQEIWNEIRNIKNDLVEIINKNEEINISNWELGYKNLIDFLKSKNNIMSSITSELICELYKAKISGKIKDRQSNDYLFIKSMYKAIKLNNDDKLVLVTNDSKDFYETKVDMFEGNKVYRLKDYFTEGSINVLGFKHIKSLYKYINSNVDINSKIDKVIEEYKNKELFNEDNDLKQEVLTNKDLRKEILNEFRRLDKSNKQIKFERSKYIEDIRDILKKCRSLSSWDDRSELKLYLWLNYHSENEIDLLSLSDILVIKNNLEKYYKIHIDMINEE